MTPFASRLIDMTRARGNPLCAGIDPHLGMIPKLFQRGDMAATAPATVEAVRDFSFELLRRLVGKVPVIKPQSAMFERLGPQGMVLMAELCREAQAEGLLVIMDAKRGDIGSTSTAYAHGFLGHDAGFPSDALTVNPFLGIDTLAPFIEVAEATSSGLFVLVRTSNPGSADIQGITAEDGRPVYHHLADQLRPLVEAAETDCGFSSIGIVAGATYPEEAAELRRLLPSALFLVPGFGAQGGGRDEAFAGFVDGPEGPEGGVVNASRGISFPADAADASTEASWRQAIDAALDAAITTLTRR
ncbi:MAG: orotidine-5'-phosphate decarboxylase [Alphaproteobacteria bacterium]|nr:orotidine-5'-phosphate decarboxylase [Alphaproteobacteria bacterium]